MSEDHVLMICGLFFLYPPYRRSAVSVVFVFKNSQNDAIPVNPIMLPFDYIHSERLKTVLSVGFGANHLD